MRKKDTKKGHSARKEVKSARSNQIARRGVKTDSDFADLMSALMSDVISGSVAPGVANAACNAGGKLLRIVELRQRYGTKAGDQLQLAKAIPLIARTSDSDRADA